MKKTVIGIIGPIAAGKDTAGEYIGKRLSIPVLQISEPLRDIAKREGLEPSRDNLISIGGRITRDLGEEYLAKLLLEKIETLGVITGMRFLGQVSYLKHHSRLILVSIDADPQVRYSRAKKRGKVGEAKSLDEFVSNEARENSEPNPQRLFACMQLADYAVTNNGGKGDLLEEIQKILERENLV